MTRHDHQPVALAAARWRRAGWALALNLPFLLCNPERPLVTEPRLRSLAIGLVLFVLPALPFVGLMIRRGWIERARSIWLLALASAAFVGLVVAMNLLGRPIAAGTIWNLEWLLCNLGIALNTLRGGPADFGARSAENARSTLAVVFLPAFLLFFEAANRVVPRLPDQDQEVQGTAYGLLTHLEPSLRTSRGTDYYFSHPPAVHVWSAGSLLYFGRLDELAIYDSRAPQPLEPSELWQRFWEHPLLLETRAPSVFLAAWTVALLCGWLTRLSGAPWLGVLGALAYATAPAVFVRSAYAGYFAIGNLLQLQILILLDEREADRSRSNSLACAIAGALAALADQKLMILPAAVVVWELLRGRADGLRAASSRALLHPLALGFAAGTALFWGYGLSISAADFWSEQVHNHLVDRLLHRNPLGFTGYPDPLELWLELAHHTGYLLLPFGVLCLARLCRTGGSGRSAGWRGSAGLWAIWSALLAISFTLVDWRQSKHLAPLTIPLHLAPARFAADRRKRIVVGLALAALVAVNGVLLLRLARDFGSLPAAKDW